MSLKDRVFAEMVVDDDKIIAMQILREIRRYEMRPEFSGLTYEQLEDYVVKRVKELRSEGALESGGSKKEAKG